jgi:hypothetical protein
MRAEDLCLITGLSVAWPRSVVSLGRRTRYEVAPARRCTPQQGPSRQPRATDRAELAPSAARRRSVQESSPVTPSLSGRAVWDRSCSVNGIRRMTGAHGLLRPNVGKNYIYGRNNRGCPKLLSNYVLMAEPPKRVTLQLADSIIDCPTRGTSMNLPIAVIQRLDAMATEARFARASRNELLAALIANTPVDAEVLEGQVSKYRRLQIADVLPGTTNSDSVVVPMRKPGRPGAQR